ncbi:hypothetical protein [Priestia megaterium]|uniref:hypothetical protein n=1 Tax=Priestia megaterium TaxID=1404 RepID=UPI0011A1D983|nr:hypothetical protein [Priestia megaterium]
MFYQNQDNEKEKELQNLEVHKEKDYDKETDYNKIFVPDPSKTQMKVYQALYRKTWPNQNRFMGPSLEMRVGKYSLDIVFLGLNGEKINYEIDCRDYHDKQKDKKRDNYLYNAYGWKVYRIDCKMIDAFQADFVADMIVLHLLHELGYEENFFELLGIITTLIQYPPETYH